MSPRLEFDQPTAVKVAELLEQNGMPRAAADVWLALCAHNPYDRQAREKLAELVFQETQAAHPMGSVDRSRYLLRTMGVSFPTPRLAQAYFDNLRLVLKDKAVQDEPGQIVLGLGAGRCGSTTLAAAFAALPTACATHENPPAIFWQPIAEQVQVHVERLKILSRHFALVFDAAHWWLNVLDRVFAEFPAAKAIGLVRETAACARSFLQTKGRGAGSLNHWAVPGNGIWSTSPGDPLYPSYAVPARLLSDPDAAKLAMIERYVTEYNDALAQAAARHADRVLIVRTEELNAPATAERLAAFLGFQLLIPSVPRNVGTTADSDKLEMTF
jgi:hypothetical protein